MRDRASGAARLHQLPFGRSRRRHAAPNGADLAAADALQVDLRGHARRHDYAHRALGPLRGGRGRAADVRFRDHAREYDPGLGQHLAITSRPIWPRGNSTARLPSERGSTMPIETRNITPPACGSIRRRKRRPDATARSSPIPRSHRSTAFPRPDRRSTRSRRVR